MLQSNPEEPIPEEPSRDEPGSQLPLTRSECLPDGSNSSRPCGYVKCRHHLNNSKHSCSLDLAELGGMTLDEVGQVMGVTRERVRQMEVEALRKFRLRVNWDPSDF